MNQSADGGLFAHWKNDFLASIVVFLVALPLCMGIAIASGVPVAAGLITGIVGGLIVGLLAGSPLQVSGPAAGLTVIMIEVVHRFGLPYLGLVVLVGGLLQVLAGSFKLGQWFRAVSPAVIHGMLAGIGVLIFASQFHVMVDDSPKGSGLENIITLPGAIAKGLPWPELGSEEQRQWQTATLRKVAQWHETQEEIREAVDENIGKAPTPEEASWETITLVSLAEKQSSFLSALEQIPTDLNAHSSQSTPRQLERRQEATTQAIAAVKEALADLEVGRLDHARASQAKAEAALVVLRSRLKNHDWAAKIGLLTILILVAWQLLAPNKLRLIPGPLLAVVISTGVAAWFSLPVLYVELPDSLLAGVHLPWKMSGEVLRDAPWAGILQSGAVIALVASAETLLCASAVDKMHQGPRTQYDRELLAQGIGNTVCGLLGALPMTGVIVRSSANVLAGGKTRLSAFLHGVWLLVFVVGLGALLRLIPTSCLAAILVYTGYKLVNPQDVKKLYQHGKGEVMVYFVTLTTIVLTDLLTGVLTGIFLAALRLLLQFSHLDLDLRKINNNRWDLHLHGAATFLRLPKLAAALDEVGPEAQLHVYLDELTYIDHACFELLMNWEKQHQATGGQLIIDWSALHGHFRQNRPIIHRAPAITEKETVEAQS